MSNLAKAEKSINVRENDKDVREIDVHLAEVPRMIDLSTLRLHSLCSTADLYNERSNLCGGESPPAQDPRY